MSEQASVDTAAAADLFGPLELCNKTCQAWHCEVREGSTDQGAALRFTKPTTTKTTWCRRLM